MKYSMLLLNNIFNIINSLTLYTAICINWQSSNLTYRVFFNCWRTFHYTKSTVFIGFSILNMQWKADIMAKMVLFTVCNYLLKCRNDREENLDLIFTKFSSLSFRDFKRQLQTVKSTIFAMISAFHCMFKMENPIKPVGLV